MIDKICLNCQKVFSVTYKNRSRKYCSLICANHHKNNGQKQFKERESIYLLNPKICKYCSNIIPYKNSLNNQYCSWDCFQESFEMDNSEKALYYKKCQFNFDVYDFPDEFDLSLLEKYNWYCTPGYNHNLKNVSGVSRDHMISKNFGWLNKIDPYFISHPANCKLITQLENNIKYVKCSLTLEELKERIKIWNSKYN